RVKELLRQLDSEQFREREAAGKELENLGRLAEPALRQALESKPSLEVRRRLEELLAKVVEQALPPESLRRLRALQVVEQIGSAQARELLKALAGGIAHAPETQEARAALERLGDVP